MKTLLILTFLSTSSALFAADVPAVQIVKSTGSPPTCTITVTVPDTTSAVAAETAAIAATNAANAVPGAPQKDSALAGKMAYAAALIPSMYRLIESVQKVSTMSDADIDAATAAAKTAADATAAALKAMRPDVR